MRHSRAVGLLVILLAWPVGASAQCLPGPDGEPRDCPLDTPRWVGQFTAISANAILGGVTAGVMQHFRGGSFTRGLANGMLGGGVVWAGKWLTAQRFSGAGLAGREVAAVGGSMVRNAGLGRGLAEELVLPVGPVRLYVRPGESWRVVPKVDATTVGWVAYGILERELEFDAAASISAGAPVFRTDGKVMLTDSDTHAAGITESGVILLADVPEYGSNVARRSFAHERVHVIQGDQIFLWWTKPVEEWAMTRAPGGKLAMRYVDINLSFPLLGFMGGWFPKHDDRPHELEAIFLAR